MVDNSCRETPNISCGVSDMLSCSVDLDHLNRPPHPITITDWKAPKKHVISTTFSLDPPTSYPTNGTVLCKKEEQRIAHTCQILCRRKCVYKLGNLGI